MLAEEEAEAEAAEEEAEAAEEEAEVVSSKQSYSNARSAVIVSSDNRRRWLPEVRISRGRLQVCAAFATRATALTRIGRNQHQPSHRRGRAGQGRRRHWNRVFGSHDKPALQVFTNVSRTRVLG